LVLVPWALLRAAVALNPWLPERVYLARPPGQDLRNIGLRGTGGLPSQEGVRA
jgi:hypothetical protein